MIIDCKEIKENARLSLKGNWRVAILITLVYSLISIIGDLMPKSSTRWFFIVTIIFDALFIFGYTAIILHIVRGEDSEVLEIFTESKRFLKGLGMTLAMDVCILLWSFLLVVPGIIATIKYSMTFYIWVDNPNIGISEAIDQSVEMTAGHKWDIFNLSLSFIGWIALTSVPVLVVNLLTNQYFFIIMSIGMIFVSPYIEVSMGTLYTELLKERENKLVS